MLCTVCHVLRRRTSGRGGAAGLVLTSGGVMQPRDVDAVYVLHGRRLKDSGCVAVLSLLDYYTRCHPSRLKRAADKEVERNCQRGWVDVSRTLECVPPPAKCPLA